MFVESSQVFPSSKSWHAVTEKVFTFYFTFTNAFVQIDLQMRGKVI